MKKILVTGSNGLLGQKLTDLYLQKPDKFLIATSLGDNRHPVKSGYLYETLDITSHKNVMDVIGRHQPDVVINAAAMTNVDQCEEDKFNCDRMNIEAVGFLVEACTKYRAKLIHLSTDFIFDGAAGPYREDDIPNPLSYYGLSKWKGEQLIVKNSPDWAIIRTVLVFGLVRDMSRSNIVLWAKSNLEAQKPMRVVDDQYRTPTLAEDLAEGCFLVEDKNARGIYNISGKDFMSVYQLIEKVAKHYNLSMECVSIVSSESLNQAAKRPPVTGFILDKSQKELGYEPHTFEEALDLLDRQIQSLMIND